MAIKNLITEIIQGEHDDVLALINTAIVERRRSLSRADLITMKVGDKVRFTETTRPAYLRGLIAQVKKINGASVVVDIANDPAYGRFAGHRNVRIPATLVERV